MPNDRAGELGSKSVWAGGIVAGIAASVAAPRSQGSIIYTAVSEPVNSSTTEADVPFVPGGQSVVAAEYDATNGLILTKQSDFADYVTVAGTPTTPTVAAIPFGDEIDGTSDLSAFDGNPVLNNADGMTGQFVESMPPQTQYIGISFEPAPSTVDYGWIGFEVTDDSSLANLSGIVTGYAYDNSGAGIAAGAVPEPSSLALLALGAARLAGYRRRSRISAR
jgi:hypothetical protein